MLNYWEQVSIIPNLETIIEKQNANVELISDQEVRGNRATKIPQIDLDDGWD